MKLSLKEACEGLSHKKCKQEWTNHFKKGEGEEHAEQPGEKNQWLCAIEYL